MERFVTMDLDNGPTDFLKVVVEAASSSALERLLGEVTAGMSRDVRDVFRAACRLSANRSIQVRRLAGSLGLSARTLQRRCETLRLPAPQQMLGWCRLLRIAALLQVPGRTCASIAASLGFSDPAEMRRYVRRFTGVTPSALRDRDPVGIALALLPHRLRANAGQENTHGIPPPALSQNVPLLARSVLSAPDGSSYS